MRPRGLALAAMFLIGALLVPASHANVVIEDRSPLAGAWPLSPQLHCTALITEGGHLECDAAGPISSAVMMRARIRGTAQVHAFVDVVGPDNVRRQVGTLDCSASCTVRLIERVSAQQALLFVYVDASPNAVVSVDIESEPFVVLP